MPTVPEHHVLSAVLGISNFPMQLITVMVVLLWSVSMKNRWTVGLTVWVGDVLQRQPGSWSGSVSQKSEMMRSKYHFKIRRVAERIINRAWPADSSAQCNCTVMTDGLWGSWDVCSTRLWSGNCPECVCFSCFKQWKIQHEIYTTVCQDCLCVFRKVFKVHSFPERKRTCAR